jgi:hypothetical protein
VRVLNEWVQCRLNERPKQQEELKALKGLLAPHSPSSSCKGTINGGLSCKRNVDGGKLCNIVDNHISLIATHLPS